jgi:phosphate transport system permease protein
MSATVEAGPATPAGPASGLSHRRPLGDRAFQVLALASGLLVLVILVLIAVTMSQKSTQWFTTEGWSGIFSIDWDPAHDKFGAMSFVYGTAVTSLIAIIIAYPVSMGSALLLNEVVPRRWAQPIVYVIDLLAVVPSVVWGMWGFIVLNPWLGQHVYPHIASAVNDIPVLGNLFGFLNGNYVSGLSFFTCGLILAIMIIPIVTSLSREVMATVPVADKEGAYALGATRWEMIRGAVWPHSQAGIIGATLLGLGRAMGETIAAALVIGASPTISSHLFTPGYSMPAVIALQFGEATVGVFRAALIGMGVLLFALTIIVNLSARTIVERNVRRTRGAA